MPKEACLLKMMCKYPVSLRFTESEWGTRSGFPNRLWGLTYDNSWCPVASERKAGVITEKAKAFQQSYLFSLNPTKRLNDVRGEGGQGVCNEKLPDSSVEGRLCLCEFFPLEKKWSYKKVLESQQTWKAKGCIQNEVKNAWHAFEKFALNAFLTDWMVWLKLWSSTLVFVMHLRWACTPSLPPSTTFHFESWQTAWRKFGATLEAKLGL